jgi:hypothetical protein
LTIVVDSARMPAEKSPGCSPMQRIFGVKAWGVRVSGVMAFTSVDASGLPSARRGERISRNALSARVKEGIVLEGQAGLSAPPDHIASSECYAGR